jgi:hypothetical protein
MLRSKTFKGATCTSGFGSTLCLSARDFPLVLQGNGKGNGKRVIEMNSDSQSEDDGKDNKGEGKGEGESQH